MVGVHILVQCIELDISGWKSVSLDSPVDVKWLESTWKHARRTSSHCGTTFILGHTNVSMLVHTRCRDLQTFKQPFDFLPQQFLPRPHSDARWNAISPVPAARCEGHFMKDRCERHHSKSMLELEEACRLISAS